VVSETSNTTSDEKRPLVAVGYGPRCIPVMQLIEAAAETCDLLWMIDASIPEMQQMTSLLDRFGPVVNIDGLTGEQILQELSPPFRPDGVVTYLDANMVKFAELASALHLPFHSPRSAAALTDKLLQRESLREVGISSPACYVITPGQSSRALALGALKWPAVLKPRSAQGSRYTFLVHNTRELDDYLAALGPARPEMVIEDYLADNPERDNGAYANYVSVESVVAEGDVSHLALTGRFPLAENFRETGFFIPAVLSDDERSEVLTLATSAIAALGVTTGCLHTEIKFTQSGPQIIEVNGRVGGGVPEMLERATGFHLVEVTLRVALGDNFFASGPLDTSRVGYRFFLQPPSMSATVASISGLDALTDYPGVDSISVHQGPGADLDWKDGSRNHIMAVAGSADDYQELLDVNRLLQHEVSVAYLNVSHF
jgi:biotin carboxylase